MRASTSMLYPWLAVTLSLYHLEINSRPPPRSSSREEKVESIPVPSVDGQSSCNIELEIVVDCEPVSTRASTDTQY